MLSVRRQNTPLTIYYSLGSRLLDKGTKNKFVLPDYPFICLSKYFCETFRAHVPWRISLGIPIFFRHKFFQRLRDRELLEVSPGRCCDCGRKGMPDRMWRQSQGLPASGCRAHRGQPAPLEPLEKSGLGYCLTWDAGRVREMRSRTSRTFEISHRFLWRRPEPT